MLAGVRSLRHYLRLTQYELHSPEPSVASQWCSTVMTSLKTVSRRFVKSIRTSKLGYPLPDKPLEIRNGKNGDPSIAIALIPWVDRPGHLDELIFEALLSFAEYSGRSSFSEALFRGTPATVACPLYYARLSKWKP